MNEQLIIRLGSQQTEAVDWLVWSELTQEVIASGRLTAATELPGLATRLGGRPVIALVPACDVVLKHVTLPSKPNRQMQQALPYMLEEEQAEEIEQLLILPAKVVQQEQQYVQQVAVVRRATLEMWLDWLQQAGFNVQKLLPDALLLPESESAVAIALGDQWLLRQGSWQVSCVDSSWWPDYLALLSLPAILSYSPWPEHVLQPHQLAPAELPLALLARQLSSQPFNLLQGKYAPKKPQNKYWLQWRSSAWLAGLCFVVYLATVAIESFKYQRQAAALRENAVTLYRTQFPSERIVNLRQQVQRKMVAIGGGAPHHTFLGLLTKVQPLLSQQPDLKLDNMRYDSKKAELRFQATAANFSSFEQLKTTLQNQGFEVEQGALSNIAGKVQGSVTMRSKE